jgi:hypothetical protein
MAVRDLEAFIRQQAALAFPSADVGPGSPFDVRVVQPLLRRLGTDPFTVDLSTFLYTRIQQAFPELSIDEGDALTDLLIKVNTLLFDPLTREISRISRCQSFKDPTVLTVEEAEALGANLFSERTRGDYSRGTARLFFGQPQNVSVSPVMFVTSKTGLHFFPTENQSVRTAEMLLNYDDELGLYYFDVNLIAEQPGSQYNVGPDSLVTIANVSSVVKVKNLRRFQFGEPAEGAVEFADRSKQELTERSMTTLRGVGAKLTKAFPELRRLNVVGMGDPEMQRDVLSGGGLGEPVAYGVTGMTQMDGRGLAKTSHFRDDQVSFTEVIGPSTVSPDSWVLTVFGAFGAEYMVRDLEVARVVSPTVLEVVGQVFVTGRNNLSWVLRRRELTLSGIPGGILYPDNTRGTVATKVDEVHIGGMFDVHVRASAVEESTLALDVVEDSSPVLSGHQLVVTSTTSVSLDDLTLDLDYHVDDPAYAALASSPVSLYTLQILDGPDAGNYTVFGALQSTGAHPVLTLSPPMTAVGVTEYRWKLVDRLTIDLVDPRAVKVSGDDLSTVQGSNVVTTGAGTDFDSVGVAENDILRIDEGPDKGDFLVTADPLAPGYTKLQLDSPLKFSTSSLSYSVFRANSAGGVDRPLIRVKSIELLDQSGQTQGVTIPYARPVDVQSRSFQNPARGVKHDLSDVRLGIVSLAVGPTSVYTVPAGATLLFTVDGAVTTTVVLSGGGMSVSAVISELNAALYAAYGEYSVAVQVGADRFGIRPIGLNGRMQLTGGTALLSLFGVAEEFTSADIRSDGVQADGGWAALEPAVDFETGLDVVQVLDGQQVGYYRWPYQLTGRAVRCADVDFSRQGHLLLRPVEHRHDQVLPRPDVERAAYTPAARRADAR